MRVFPSGKSFLEEAPLGEVACLVTDIGMPELDGYELQRLAMKERPNLPVIFITGNADIMASAEADGFSHGKHFQKPFDSYANRRAKGALTQF